MRDRSGKPTARNERGLVADSPTRRGTPKRRKAINNNRFKLTPNEWDTAEALGDNYFVYYLVINDEGKNIFVIQNPIKQFELGNLKIDKNLVVEFSKTSGQWHKLLEIAS